MKHVRLSLLVLLMGAFVSMDAHAQVQTGKPPFGTFSGNPDVIDLANLNSNITIPFVNKAGRGMSFSYDLVYDSSIWTPVNSGSTRSWSPH